FSSRRRHTRFSRDWSSDVCSSDLHGDQVFQERDLHGGVVDQHPAMPAERLLAFEEPDIQVWTSRSGVVLGHGDGESQIGRSESHTEEVVARPLVSQHCRHTCPITVGELRTQGTLTYVSRTLVSLIR